MKKLSVILTAVIMAALLGACVPEARTDINIDPDFSGKGGNVKELDFFQVHNDVMDSFGDANPFIFINDVEISGNNGTKTVYINAKCMEGVEKEDADMFISACMRYIADSASVQLRDLEGSSRNSFGSIWNTYSLEATVTADTEGAETVSKISIPAGTEIPLDPDIEKYEKEWQKELEILLRNAE